MRCWVQSDMGLLEPWATWYRYSLRDSLVDRLECSTGIGNTVQNKQEDLNCNVWLLHEEPKHLTRMTAGATRVFNRCGWHSSEQVRRLKSQCWLLHKEVTRSQISTNSTCMTADATCDGIRRRRSVAVFLSLKHCHCSSLWVSANANVVAYRVGPWNCSWPMNVSWMLMNMRQNW